MNEEIFNLLIIVFFQILSALLITKKHDASITKSIKRLESSSNQGGNDKLAQDIYTLVESSIDKLIRQTLYGSNIDRDKEEITIIGRHKGSDSHTSKRSSRRNNEREIEEENEKETGDGEIIF